MELIIHIQHYSNYSIIQLNGDIDANNWMKVDSELKNVIKSNMPKNLLVDCTSLAYISSAGLRLFIQNNQLANQIGTSMSFFSMTEMVHKTFELLGLATMLTIYADKESALASLQ